MSNKRSWTPSAFLAAAALVVLPAPSAPAAPDKPACQALQAAGPSFHQLDEKRAAVQNQLKALRAAPPKPVGSGKSNTDTWRDLQHQLGGLFRETQQLLERTADGVANDAADQALRDQASAYKDLADVQDEMASPDKEEGSEDELTGRFNDAAGRIAPAADRLNAVERDVCSTG